jgi:hypothetical protein
MNCEIYRTDLKAYSDRELPLFRRLAIRRHLAACASCRNEVRTMEQISKNLQSTEAAEPLSNDLRTRILSEAAKQGKPAKSSSSSPLPGGEGGRGGEVRRRLSPTLVGAICTVFAVAAFFAMHPGFVSHLPQQSAESFGSIDKQTALSAQPQAVEQKVAAPSAAKQKSFPQNYAGALTFHDSNSYNADASQPPGKFVQNSAKWQNGTPLSSYDFAPAGNSAQKTATVSGNGPVKAHGESTTPANGSITYSINSPLTLQNGRGNSGQGALPSNSPTNVAGQPSGTLYAAPPPAGRVDNTKANSFVGGGGGVGGQGTIVKPANPPATDMVTNDLSSTKNEAAPPVSDSPNNFKAQAPQSPTNAPAPGSAGRGFGGTYGLSMDGQALDDLYHSDGALNRQVHREASVTVQLKDPESASDQVDRMVKEAGGYVSSNNLTTDGSGSKSAQMVLKVPVAQFDTVLGEIEKLGNVTAKNVTGEDITGKVSDANTAESVLDEESTRANARLQTLGKRAKWSDVQDARNLRIAVAQARARVDLLDKLAALADITVSLTQTPAPAPPAQSGFLNNLKGNSADAFQSLISSVGGLLTMVIWALAYAPIWGPLAFAAWYALRRKREHSQMSGV